jgi:hypothetical protein
MTKGGNNKAKPPVISASEARRRTYVPQPISASLGRMMKRSPIARSARGLAALKRDWADVAGDEFAEIAWPDRLDPARNGRPGVLAVKAAAGAALILQHDGPRLVERVNGYLGAGAIGRIRIAPGAPPRRVPRKMPPKPIPEDHPQAEALAEKAAGVGSDRLAAALTRLGRSVAGKR